MNENEGKDLAVDMKQDLLDTIKELKRQKIEERDNENIDIKYYKDCEFKVGKRLPLKVSIAEIREKNMDENNEEKEIITYDIYMKYKGQDVRIGTINEVGDLEVNKELIEEIDPDNKLGLLELGEDEKPDLSVLEGLEGKTEEELEEEISKEKESRGKEDEAVKDEVQDEIEDEKDEKENEEKPRDVRRGLQELNLGVLVLINPKLRECSKAYLDPNTNSLVFKDKFGKVHGPEEYGFQELKAEDGNFALSKMDKEGEVSSHENPTRVYGIKGSNFGVSIDFATHHREANLIVKDREEGHEDSYSVIEGSLAIAHSGHISTYRTSWDIGIREGIYKSGDRDETNEMAKDILERTGSENRKELQEGFAEQGNSINDKDDLKNAIKDVLMEEHGRDEESAEAIANKMVYEYKSLEEAERENLEEQTRENPEEQAKENSERPEGGRDIGEEAYERLHGRR